MRCQTLRKHTKSFFICPASTLCRIILLTWPEFNRAGVCKKYKYLEVKPVLLITHHSLLAILDFHKQKEQASHAADLLCGGETVFIILYWLLAYEKTKELFLLPVDGLYYQAVKWSMSKASVRSQLWLVEAHGTSKTAASCSPDITGH